MGVLMLNEINYSGGSGGGGSDLLDGSTVTPTDNIQIWLACAELTETYTTLNEVLADDDIMEKLFRSENASDYLVRSTTWASGIVADQTAMILIGANDYCADKLLDDSTWRTAICNSTYFESVLNIKVPIMTSATQPKGEAGSTVAVLSDGEAWKGFSRDTDYYHYGWTPSEWNGIGWYKFTTSEYIYKATILLKDPVSREIKNTVQVVASNDGSNWTDIGASFVMSGTNATDVTILVGSTKYLYWGWKVLNSTTGHTTNNGYGYMMQFYGRVSQTTIYSAANDIVSFVDDEGAKVVITDATGKGEVTIVCKPNTDITFTSSVAKDPDNLSENYSKVITIESNSNAVYVMPNNDVLYWYGYMSSKLGSMNTTNGWGGNVNKKEPTYNTNYVSLDTTSYTGVCGVGTIDSVSNKNTLHAITQGMSTGASDTYGFLRVYDSKNLNSAASTQYAISDASKKHCVMDISSKSGYMTADAWNGRYFNLYALWYEDGSDDNYDKADADLIAPVQKTLTAKKAYAVGEQFVYNQTLYKVKQSIAQGAQITIGTNCELAGSITEQIGYDLKTYYLGPASPYPQTLTNSQRVTVDLSKYTFIGLSIGNAGNPTTTNYSILDAPIWVPVSVFRHKTTPFEMSGTSYNIKGTMQYIDDTTVEMTITYLGTQANAGCVTLFLL